MLRELVQALDALPEKRLAAGSLVTAEGEYCTLGALGRARGMDMAPIDPEDREAVAKAFGVAEALAAEIMYLNDEEGPQEQTAFNFVVCGPMRPWESHTQLRWKRNEQAGAVRWSQMRAWAVAHLKGGFKLEVQRWRVTRDRVARRLHSGFCILGFCVADCLSVLRWI